MSDKTRTVIELSVSDPDFPVLSLDDGVNKIEYSGPQSFMLGLFDKFRGIVENGHNKTAAN